MNCIHIATEGPLGWAARQICRTRKFPFTTSYHTRFPEYVRLRLPIPVRLSYAVIKAFHRPALRTMVATRPLQQELTSRGFNNLVVWPRGVDTGLFRPRPKDSVDIARPMAMYIGRVAVEKNIEAFLGLDFPKNKYVVGDGPARAGLARKYPEAIFTGYKTGEELAVLAATADVFVFPSRTDTFGVVLLEAMASGVPVAAFPVTGPAETVRNGVNGWLDVDLQHAVRQALLVPSDSCRQFALSRGWASCSRQFYSHLAICHEPFGK